ncbi:MAG: helix-turn-helix transcriptional regulator [Erysipelotrichaceae bacterium]|nr:helix-turn-helix transcriptional regulator [Erysipelotrichaceae bacterium]
MNKNFGDYLYALRTEKGWTQQHLADLLGVTNKTVSKWERNEGYPSIDTLLSLSKLFNVSVDELLKGEQNSCQDNRIEILLHGWNSKKIIMFSNFILVIGLLLFFGLYFLTHIVALSFFMFLIIAVISLFLLVYKQEQYLYLTQKARSFKDYSIWLLSFCGCVSLMLPCLLARTICRIVLGKPQLSYISYHVYLSFKDYLISWLPVGMGLALLFLFVCKVVYDGSYERLKKRIKKVVLGYCVGFVIIVAIFAFVRPFSIKSETEFDSFKSNYLALVDAFEGEAYNVDVMNEHFMNKKRYEQYMNVLACWDIGNVIVYRPSIEDYAIRITITNWMILLSSIGSGFYLFYKKKDQYGESEDA